MDLQRKANVVGSVRRKAVSSPHQDWMKFERLNSKAIPFVVEPAIDGVDLIEWVRSQRGFINELLLQHRALLFRGFRIRTANEFGNFVQASSSGELLEYRDRSTPRLSRGEKIYTSTIYPADERINLHNEGTYWASWPLLIYFCCLQPAKAGGQTPIADVSNVYRHIDSALRDRFERKHVMYVRNYNEGFGLPWQEVFQTKDPLEVEAYCQKNGIAFEWKGRDRLRTRQVRPAARTNTRTGDRVWFNHAAFFNVAALDSNMREALCGEFGEENLPYNTYFGDGSRIEPAEVEHILDAYRRECIMFSWREGDVLMMDNMSIAHGREPYSGDREVLTALVQPFTESSSPN